ncbi:nicotinamide mononucleotide transporter [Phocoenobacter skyensis]|uniref:Nicotinamide mononucleotide transporter n=1 Tax=Phocoenobacter skyensis TaxID=97481 RepID=A0A1H7VDY2_9PAST|nr:nicotinamide mononucleotide transporter [Pasteurella skyensis]MDP8079370.1 nicotinamide mononucleotide transporter [Pasteurella skyensis]MDP8085242.1 nicotinamide mononucleotide transporter [Pasteurella skyensis]MDP8171662.1 nicotinamide mononucleotide transporter [Pasteurella skyensis]MDP8175821.1 nicotinamide mononucleotide transporter [Pasteurella skyensis]MDP8184301.1 nicotinamide mononucleotide transporter [Pasteurella skyensis]
MGLVLQIWAAGFYLLNKFLFAVAEKKQGESRKKLKMGAWISYLIGVCAWIVILAGENNWIATAVEAGGIPAMLLGLYNTYHNNKKHNKYFNRFVLLFTYLSLALGFGYSIIIHNGVTRVSQVLEMGMVFGFLLGSYFMAKNNPKGWLFFMLMNVSAGTLMLLQDKLILVVQQLLSLSLVIYGYYSSQKKGRYNKKLKSI